MRVLFLLSFVFASLFALSDNFIEMSDTKVANGKTALIEFKNKKELQYKSVFVSNKEFKIFKTPFDAEISYALIPLSYYEKLGKKELRVKYREGKQENSKTLTLNVISGKYAKEEIAVDSKKVNPKSKAVKNRIAQEYKEAMSIYGRVTPKSYISKPFILPLESKITSAFGKARIYNGSLKGYHSGTDFRASTGTPIIAANDAEVALVKKRFYSGGTVLLNHGQGVYTCYFHMSQFKVKKGDIVKRGEILGLSGQSGRVTGPHLHFSARINGVQVDPLQLVQLINTKLLQKGN